MFLVMFQYQNTDLVDRLLADHYANPEGLFAQNLVHLAGRLQPRTGGLMIVDADRATVEPALASDPFIKSGAATATLTEFLPTWPRAS